MLNFNMCVLGLTSELIILLIKYEFFKNQDTSDEKCGFTASLEKPLNLAIPHF